MYNNAIQQQSGQNSQKSTTVWSQPSNEEQEAYYSKHAAERRVFGWISAFLQFAHGLLAFASFGAIYTWVLASFPAVQFIIPIASAGTLLALHMLFRTTWQTYWYDKLDNDIKTDSPIWIPLAIIFFLLIIEVNGAFMFLEGQVKPPKKEGTESVESSYASIVASIDASLRTDQQNTEAVFTAKSKSASAGYDRQIRSLNRRSANTEADRRSLRNQVASLETQRDRVLEPINAAKASALEKALATANERKETEAKRRGMAVAMIDHGNISEVKRHSNQLGNVGVYAWVLSLCLLTIISALLYRMVRINVKSGILPLRNYTILDAHGSVAERLWTAFSDAFNRRGLQIAVIIHRWLSPNEAITSFDGTVVATPGTYNTPKGFFPPDAQNVTPESEEQLKNKAYKKVMEEASKGGILVTPQLLDLEMDKARRMNGSYERSELGKHEPSASTATAGGVPYPAAEKSYDKLLVAWGQRVQALVDRYDNSILGSREKEAEEAKQYIMDPNGPIQKEALRLGVRLAVEASDDEVVVYRPEFPEHKVPLSLLSESSLKATSDPKPSDLSEIRFKSDLNQFGGDVKLLKNGDLIGISYRKENGHWSPLGKAGVQSRLRIAEKNASEPDASPKVISSLQKWRFAMALINKAHAGINAEIEPVIM